jgi:hypothetical protein
VRRVGGSRVCLRRELEIDGDAGRFRFSGAGGCWTKVFQRLLASPENSRKRPLHVVGSGRLEDRRSQRSYDAEVDHYGAQLLRGFLLIDAFPRRRAPAARPVLRASGASRTHSVSQNATNRARLGRGRSWRPPALAARASRNPRKHPAREPSSQSLRRPGKIELSAIEGIRYATPEHSRPA